ncbi:MAG TPA: lysophospholipid acyltransferase family protein [Lichenihabitans sp.]|jgi:putative hemolysin|nr:lysophospholipid acyltransferase family protein [Lichenihabitans sp.]
MSDPVFSYADASMPPVKRGLIRIVEAATGQRRLRRIYMAHRREARADADLWGEAVRRLALDVRYDPAALAAIPEIGPCVVVANHPYGVLDGIVLSWLVQKVRPDFLVLTHAALLKAPELKGFLLPVDFAGTPAATETNLRSRAIARRHLAAGGCIVVFPAGGISTAPDRLGRKRAVDAPWQPFAAQLIQRSRATVVPVCFEGQNSRPFQIASHLSASLRLALIFHEVSTRIGSTLRVAIGAPIACEDLERCATRQTMAAELKARTYALAATFPSRDGGPRRPKRLRLRRHDPDEPRRPLLHRAVKLARS